MTNLDDHLRHNLQRLASRMPATDITEGSVRRGEQLRLRRRTIGATVGVAVLVAAVVVPITLASRSTHHPRQSTAIRPTPTAAKTLDPSHGGNDTDWEVVAPQLVPIVGGVPLQQPTCTPGDVTARARTRPIPGGVAGIVTLVGAHCAISITQGPDELLGADGRELHVHAIPLGDQKNPIQTPRPDIALADGNVIWSFTWTGSWCGYRASDVVLPLNDPNTDSLGPIGRVVAPLVGPQPACHGHSTSVLVAGPPAQPGQPDLPPPAQWSGLTAQLSVPPVLHGSSLTGINVTLHNTTGQPILLAPCPSFALSVQNARGDGGSANDGSESFPCPPQARVIPAHQSVTVALPAGQLDPQDTAPDRPTEVTVRFGILGVPIAATSALESAYG